MAGPLAGFGVVLLATWAGAGGAAATFVASMAVGALAGGGKLVILAGALADAPVGTWGLAALLVYLDLATALVALAGLPLLYRIPGAGPRIAAARSAGWRFVRRHPWAYRATWLSLAGFVAVPFNGTGALVGAFLGRMLGLSRPAIVTATVFGSVTGSIALALAGDLWAERVSTVAGHPILAVAAVLTLATLAILASKWMFGEATDTETPLSTGG